MMQADDPQYTANPKHRAGKHKAVAPLCGWGADCVPLETQTVAGFGASVSIPKSANAFLILRLSNLP